MLQGKVLHIKYGDVGMEKLAIVQTDLLEVENGFIKFDYEKENIYIVFSNYYNWKLGNS